MRRIAGWTMFRSWVSARRRWPLTRQVAIGFATLMIVNAVLISVALEVWGNRRVEMALATMSPATQRAYRKVESGEYKPTPEELQKLMKEFQPVEDQLNAEANFVVFLLIAIASGVTLLVGYLALGSLGRGLNQVAGAARRIADGDLTARADAVGFSSREESQLTGDFNLMAAALQRAERELAESTASIAHELRTPLTILRGRLQGMADGVFQMEPHQVKGLLYQVEGLGRLVDDLQTLSLANSQRLALNVEKTDLALEVCNVLDAMAPDLTAAGLEPVLSLTETPLEADGARLRQAIAAILANACRYAAKSGVLRVASRVEGGAAILEIVDHGPGLPEGAEALAFDRFWRGEPSRSRNTGGSGLGLAVVRAIVEAHHGSATLKNHNGGGAIFEMRLPKTIK